MEKVKFKVGWGLSAVLSIVLGCVSAVTFAQDDSSAFAQDDSSAEVKDDSSAEVKEIEEVVVVGTQIKGAKIKGLLPVNVITAEDIEDLGIDSGDALLEAIPENGQNFFNEAENISGGVNSARGDIGAYNLRNLGTGNTLALLNGRRLVNAAGFQTEEVGGSFVPVNTSNSNVIPVYGVSRIEVLKDGASALYGADAVAGVINTVLKSDFEGLNVRFKQLNYDNFDRSNSTLNLEYGSDFDDGKGNIGVFVDYFNRDRINSLDDPRWSNSDYRDRIPEGSPWEGNNNFRNTSINSQYGQYDVVSSVGSSHSLRTNGLVDSAGEFVIYPVSNSRCSQTDTFVINSNVCGIADNAAANLRYNLWGNDVDLRGQLTRINIFTYLTYDFGSVEFFGELGLYKSETNTKRHPSAPFSSVKLRISPENPYNPFGSGSGRLPASVIGDDVPAAGLELFLDNYRFIEAPRTVDNDGQTYRFLGGLRGQQNDWDWETAIVLSKATKEDITRNRVSNTLVNDLLRSSAATAYNPFHGLANPTIADTNLAPALIDVYRKSESGLEMVDFKITNPSIATLSGGDVALLIGTELRRESFADDRDSRLDGTIKFTDYDGDTYPYVSDVVNSSPTPDSSGDRTVFSLFSEAILPISDSFTAQLALRYENYSDTDDPIVGKFAFGWQPSQQFLLRGSIQQSFRAPNLVTINEDMVARSNTRDDHVCFYVDPNEDELDCSHSIQRTSVGSKDLVAEKSINSSIGVVFTPADNITVTADYWSIAKSDSIGLFGEENHTIIELLNLIDAGNTSCDNVNGNSAVIRNSGDVTEYNETERGLFSSKNICPVGEVTRIDDKYQNLDKRNLEGVDLGVYFEAPLSFGSFKYKFNYSRLLKYEQEASGDAARIVNAVANGTLPASIPVDGFGDLIGRDGNQEERFKMDFKLKVNTAGTFNLSWNRIGEFYQSSLTLTDGTRYIIPDMDTYNLNYHKNIGDIRIKVGINNFTDERAPLADRFFGFFADAHRDYGRYYYVDVKYKIF